MSCNHYLDHKRSKDNVEYFECRSCKFKFTPSQLQEVFTNNNKEIKRLRKELKDTREELAIVEANAKYGEWD